MKLHIDFKKHLKTIIFAAVNVLLLILIGICIWRCASYGNSLRSQQAAQAWKGSSDLRFAQTSAYMPVDELVEEAAVLDFRNTLEKKLADAGVEGAEDVKLWTDAYSTTGELIVKGERGETNVTAIAVGGNFFTFHPYYLLSGSYLSEADLMKDRVVLDYDLAWKLFGSSSLEGMTVEIAGKPYYVAGVVKRETDKFSTKAFEGDPVMFIHYSAYSEILGEDAKIGISCYELVLHEPITGFAKNVVTDGFPVGDGAVVENSSRFSLASIFDIFKNFGDRSIQKYPVVYPYWENAARVAEVNIARLWLVIAFLGIIPFICLIVLAIRLIIFLIRKLKQGAHSIYEAWDDRYARIEKFREKHPTRKAKRAMNNGNVDSDFEHTAAETTKEDAEAEGEEIKAEKRVHKEQEKARIRREKHQHKMEKTHAKREKAGRKNIAEKPEPKAPQVPLSDIFNEADVSLDVESIVREIMNESKQEK